MWTFSLKQEKLQREKEAGVGYWSHWYERSETEEIRPRNRIDKNWIVPEIIEHSWYDMSNANYFIHLDTSSHQPLDG